MGYVHPALIKIAELAISATQKGAGLHCALKARLAMVAVNGPGIRTWPGCYRNRLLQFLWKVNGSCQNASHLELSIIDLHSLARSCPRIGLRLSITHLSCTARWRGAVQQHLCWSCQTPIPSYLRFHIDDNLVGDCICHNIKLYRFPLYSLLFINYTSIKLLHFHKNMLLKSLLWIELYPPKDICWNSIPQYLKMWLYLKMTSLKK